MDAVHTMATSEGRKKIPSMCFGMEGSTLYMSTTTTNSGHKPIHALTQSASHPDIQGEARIRDSGQDPTAWAGLG